MQVGWCCVLSFLSLSAPSSQTYLSCEAQCSVREAYYVRIPAAVRHSVQSGRHITYVYLQLWGTVFSLGGIIRAYTCSCEAQCSVWEAYYVRIPAAVRHSVQSGRHITCVYLQLWGTVFSLGGIIRAYTCSCEAQFSVHRAILTIAKNNTVTLTITGQPGNGGQPHATPLHTVRMENQRRVVRS